MKAKGVRSVTGKRKSLAVLAFEAKHRDRPRAVARYLNDALSTNDPALITKAIGRMMRAHGVARLAEKAGMRRDSLYRSFGGEFIPPFDRVIIILQALDIQLIAKPAIGFGRDGLKAKK
jgi:probable addiction module antidote protein